MVIRCDYSAPVVDYSTIVFGRFLYGFFARWPKTRRIIHKKEWFYGSSHRKRAN